MRKHGSFLILSSLQRFAEETAEAAEAAAAAEPEAAPAEPTDVPAEEVPRIPDTLLDLLARKYGVDAADTDALERAVREETDSNAAQNDSDPQQIPDSYARGAARIYDGWMDQAAQTAHIYPDFDLKAEMANPRFVRLLRSQVDMQTAYEVVHKDEIIPAAMQYAARTVEQKLASSLRSAGNRPAENGMNSQGAVMLGSDVSRLSRKDYAEICQRVARGERVSFG